MPALHEKVLWPLVGIMIFAILAAFYIDDRRRISQEKSATTSQTMSSKPEPAEKRSEKSSSSYAEKKSTTSTDTSSKQTVSKHEGFFGSIDDYLAQATDKRSTKLIAAAKEHTGFAGSLGDYLSGAKSAPEQVISPNTGSVTSMSMDEYMAKTKSQSDNAYQGGMEDYLQKYGEGNLNPFNREEHTGFHGTYEEYAKKFK